jgi:hypothetical protein
MRQQIEKAIKETLIVENPKGIKYCVDKIEKLIKQAYTNGSNDCFKIFNENGEHWQ